jgi:3-dehydro-L-gulonate 2-dehydrogenase
VTANAAPDTGGRWARVAYDELFDELVRISRALGFDEDRARRSARIFADASRDGVHSHGLNRFPLFVSTVEDGFVRIEGKPERISAFGALERWDGHLGPGNLNAEFAMARAIALAREHGLGGVALQNTNHWMRGGTYGWQAADAGMIALCWSNTKPNLPPWGSREPRLGNNPLVIAIPRGDGHVVLDMAISQFSYGQLQSHQRQGKPLPVAGGYDRQGELTRDPHEIEATERPLPIGYWKGSGLSLVLDLLAALLTGGKATHQITPEESALSQVFLAIDPVPLRTEDAEASIVDEVIAYVHGAMPVDDDAHVSYPGERSLETRRDSLLRGVAVDVEVWERVRRLYRTA